MKKNLNFTKQIFFLIMTVFVPTGVFSDAGLQKIEIVQGKSEIINIKSSISTVMVGDDSIADIIMLTEDSFFVFAKKPGVTNVQVLNSDNQLLSVITVSVGVDLAGLSEVLSSALPDSDIRVQHSPDGVALLGWVNSNSDRERAINISTSYASNVVDAIKVRNQRQVYVQVRFIEIASRKARELGGEASVLGNLRASKIAGFAPKISVGGSIDSQITALLERGEAKYLAAPTLTALVGTTSSFLAGGEFPVLSTGSDGQTQTEFKEYGVRLSFTPTINDNGAISLTLEPEVSGVDENRSTESSVALTTRRAKTTTEVQSGETIMLAGLLQSSSSRGINSIPGLGEMPIVGPLFRKAKAGDSKTELIILVTPTLSRPDKDSMKLQKSIAGTELTDGEEFFIDQKLKRPTFSIRNVVDGLGISGEFGHILNVQARDR